ncbi:MAG: hypothetical protein WCT22_04135 [Patescibacteria group bacterium]
MRKAFWGLGVLLVVGVVALATVPGQATNADQAVLVGSAAHADYCASEIANGALEMTVNPATSEHDFNVLGEANDNDMNVTLSVDQFAANETIFSTAPSSSVIYAVDNQHTVGLANAATNVLLVDNSILRQGPRTDLNYRHDSRGGAVMAAAIPADAYKGMVAS